MNLIKRSFRIPGELAKALGQVWQYSSDDVLGFRRCPVCGATVHTDDQQIHTDWHIELAERLG